jgi:uncharacterized protein YjaG (DUF416 family)
MLRNPIHKRMEKFESWQNITFMACLCERMYPNYYIFCQQTEQYKASDYRKILDLVWESLVVKGAKVNFDSQLEKLESAIPDADQFDIYGVYPAIDACAALSELLHAHLSGETLEHAIRVSEISIGTVAMYEMTRRGQEMTDDELKSLDEIQSELDVQWQIFRLLKECEERDIDLIKGLRTELVGDKMSNLCIKIEQ